jgi:hypothetical protein
MKNAQYSGNVLEERGWSSIVQSFGISTDSEMIGTKFKIGLTMP